MTSCNYERQAKRALAADGREARRKARDDRERWSSGGDGHMPLGQWDVFSLSLVSDSRYPMGQKLRNGITKHFRYSRLSN